MPRKTAVARKAAVAAAATKYPTISHAACEANGFCIHEGKQWDQTDAYTKLTADELISAAEAANPTEMNEVPADPPELGEADEPDEQDNAVRFPTTGCACGCGEPVTSGRYFRQGHDQRLIGMLANIAACGQQVSQEQGGSLVTRPARQYGAQFLTEAGLTKLDNAILRAKQTLAARADRTAKRARRDKLAARTDQIVSGPRPGDAITVKIGRHTYTAKIHGMNQSGKVTAVAYATKSAPDVQKVTEKFQIV